MVPCPYSGKIKEPECLDFKGFQALNEQGMRESNSHQRFWRPLSYHLTNPLYQRSVITSSATNEIITDNAVVVKRRWRDLNPRTGCPIYRISSADPSATWVHLHV